MEQDQATSSEDKPVVSNRVMEVITGLAFLAVGGLVVWDSVRLGHTWAPSGPQPGYFPFYIGLFLIASGAFNAIRVLLPATKAYGDEAFVTRSRLKSVLMVFLPTLAYVVLMQYVGLYVAAALFIIGFMMINGKYSLLKSLPYGLVVPVLLFFMFEKWFLISLPKGPVEAFLGL